MLDKLPTALIENYLVPHLEPLSGILSLINASNSRTGEKLRNYFFKSENHRLQLKKYIAQIKPNEIVKLLADLLKDHPEKFRNRVYLLVSGLILDILWSKDSKTSNKFGYFGVWHENRLTIQNSLAKFIESFPLKIGLVFVPKLAIFLPDCYKDPTSELDQLKRFDKIKQLMQLSEFILYLLYNQGRHIRLKKNTNSTDVLRIRIAEPIDPDSIRKSESPELVANESNLLTIEQKIKERIRHHSERENWFGDFHKCTTQFLEIAAIRAVKIEITGLFNLEQLRTEFFWSWIGNALMQNDETGTESQLEEITLSIQDCNEDGSPCDEMPDRWRFQNFMTNEVFRSKNCKILNLYGFDLDNWGHSANYIFRNSAKIETVNVKNCIQGWTKTWKKSDFNL